MIVTCKDIDPLVLGLDFLLFSFFFECIREIKKRTMDQIGDVHWASDQSIMVAGWLSGWNFTGGGKQNITCTQRLNVWCCSLCPAKRWFLVCSCFFWSVEAWGELDRPSCWSCAELEESAQIMMLHVASGWVGGWVCSGWVRWDGCLCLYVGVTGAALYDSLACVTFCRWENNYLCFWMYLQVKQKLEMKSKKNCVIQVSFLLKLRVLPLWLAFKSWFLPSIRFSFMSKHWTFRLENFSSQMSAHGVHWLESNFFWPSSLWSNYGRFFTFINQFNLISFIHPMRSKWYIQRSCLDDRFWIAYLDRIWIIRVMFELSGLCLLDFKFNL